MKHSPPICRDALKHCAIIIVVIVIVVIGICYVDTAGAVVHSVKIIINVVNDHRCHINNLVLCVKKREREREGQPMDIDMRKLTNNCP